MQRRGAIRVKAAEAGQSVLALLCRRFDYLAFGDWQGHIACGRILLNGLPAAATACLETGDRLEFFPPPQTEPPVRRDYALVYEDAQILAVDKPPNLPCHPAGRYFEHSLWYLLKTECGLSQPIFVHRIDRETSGVVLVAKTRTAAARCRRHFEAGRVEKRYLAVVEGTFPGETVHAEGCLTPDPDSAIRKKRRFAFPFFPAEAPPGAQPCLTVFRRLATDAGLSLVEARPHTGRRHQIRASLHGLGFPIVGDKLYGVDDTLFLRFLADTLSVADRRRLRIGRQALHAAELHIDHPQHGRRLHLAAVLPEDMRSLVPAAATVVERIVA